MEKSRTSQLRLNHHHRHQENEEAEAMVRPNSTDPTTIPLHHPDMAKTSHTKVATASI
jgi:hypothetical protein